MNLCSFTVPVHTRLNTWLIMQTVYPNEIKQLYHDLDGLIKKAPNSIMVKQVQPNAKNGLKKGWHFHPFCFIQSKVLIQQQRQWLYLFEHVGHQVIQTFIKQRPLSHSASHQNTRPRTQTHRLTCIHTAAKQLMSNMGGADASSGLVGGGHTHTHHTHTLC